MYQFFHLVVFRCLHRGEYLEGQRHCRIVEFLASHINGAAALANLYPILAKTGVSQYINVTWFFVVHLDFSNFDANIQILMEISETLSFFTTGTI